MFDGIDILAGFGRDVSLTTCAAGARRERARRTGLCPRNNSLARARTEPVDRAARLPRTTSYRHVTSIGLGNSTEHPLMAPWCHLEFPLIPIVLASRVAARRRQVNPPRIPFFSGEVREQRSPQTLKPAAELLAYESPMVELGIMRKNI